MPLYGVAFTYKRTYNDGYVELEADSPEDAWDRAWREADEDDVEPYDVEQLGD
jgi:hypothetical protein